MRILFSLLSCVSVCLSVPVPEADPIAEAYASDYTYYLPASSPSSQFHAQDEVGQYNYGYQSADQTKTEVKSADGVVRGSYSYVDANGIVQTTNYISDALGFRVAATNLPVHQVEGVAVPAVADAPVVEVAPVAQAVAAPTAAVVAAPAVPAVAAAPVHNAIMTPSVSYAYLPYASNYDYHVLPTQYVQAAARVVQAAPAVVSSAAPVSVAQAAPVVKVAAAPVVPVVQQASVPAVPVGAPALPTSSQYHAQDELGQYSFGYNDANSVRQETKTADGAVTGAYRYVDSEGRIQTVQYIADAGGFRVAGSNLPVFAAQAPVDTPEVAAAKVQHAQAYSAAQAAASEALAAEQVVVAAPLPISEVNAVPSESVTEEKYFGAAETYNQAAPVAAAPVVQAAPVAVAPVVQATPVAVAPVVQAAPVATPTAEQYFGAAKVYNQAAPVAQVAPVVQAAATPVVPAAPVAPVSAASQYHSQDEIGQYAFGYSDANSIKQEVKTADGIVRGSYSYVDGDGLVQTVNYIADALGFRVGATNLPVHVVNDAAAPAEVPAAVPVAAQAAPVDVAYEAQPVVSASPVMSPLISYSYLPYATNYGYNLPAAPVVQAAPVAVEATPAVVETPVPAVSVNAAPAAIAPAVAAPAVVASAVVPNDVSSQYHAQDELGQYNYGYSSATQTKSELKTADGITRGSYSYIDANGLVQTVNYISDAMGFRVAATNLPVHQVEGEAVGAPVEAAKYNVLTPNVNYAYLPYAQNYAYTSPAAAA